MLLVLVVAGVAQAWPTCPACLPANTRSPKRTHAGATVQLRRRSHIPPCMPSSARALADYPLSFTRRRSRPVRHNTERWRWAEARCAKRPKALDLG